MNDAGKSRADARSSASGSPLADCDCGAGNRIAIEDRQHDYGCARVGTWRTFLQAAAARATREAKPGDGAAVASHPSEVG